MHRDLKPANIFLTSEGKVKLGDFGISKLLPLSGALAQTQCGTPLYMSPEMASGHPYSRAADAWAGASPALDPRDLWVVTCDSQLPCSSAHPEILGSKPCTAVGCILYEMMSLRPPWLGQLGPRAAADGVAGLMRVVRKERLQTEGLRGHYSEELCALLSALVTRDPAKRVSVSSVLSWPPMLRAGAQEAEVLKPGCDDRQSGPEDHPHPQPQPHPHPSGLDDHGAAHAIQRSFRGQRRETLVVQGQLSPGELRPSRRCPSERPTSYHPTSYPPTSYHLLLTTYFVNSTSYVLHLASCIAQARSHHRNSPLASSLLRCLPGGRQCPTWSSASNMVLDPR